MIVGLKVKCMNYSGPYKQTVKILEKMQKEKIQEEIGKY